MVPISVNVKRDFDLKKPQKPVMIKMNALGRRINVGKVQFVKILLDRTNVNALKEMISRLNNLYKYHSLIERV